MNKNTNSLLSLENISVSFEGFLALNDLNLSLKKRRIKSCNWSKWGGQNNISRCNNR